MPEAKQSVAIKPRYYVEWLLFLGFSLLVRLLPMPLARGLLAGFFDLVGRLISSQNRRMERSLQIAFPEHSVDWRRTRRRQAWRNLGRSIAEVMKPRASQNSSAGVRGLQAELEMSAIRQDPRGTLLLSGHFGAWEAMAGFAGLLQRPFLIFYRPLENPLIDAALRRSRLRAGINLVSIHEPDAVRIAIRHLSAGGVLCLFADQRWARGEHLPLFGQPALTTLAAGLLQRATDARVAMLVHRRTGEAKQPYEAVLEALPFDMQPEDGWRDRGRSIMTAFNARLEDWVRAHPDSWFWMQDRWKP